MQRIISTALLAAAITAAAANAQVYVRIGPPPPRREIVVRRPGPRHIWVAGFYEWDGRAYSWVPGRWAIPPRHYHAWVPGHWRQTRRGYIWVDGHWR